MKILLSTAAAAILALTAGGMAQAGGKPAQHHEPRVTDHDRHERFDRHDYREYREPYRSYCEYPCYDYCPPCYDDCECWYPSCEYPCYDYCPPCGPDRGYRPYKDYRGRTSDRPPVHFKGK